MILKARQLHHCFAEAPACGGGAQVLSLLSGVLGLLFPPQPRHAMSYLSVLNVDLRRLVQLDCHGLDFYARWRLRSARPPPPRAALDSRTHSPLKISHGTARTVHAHAQSGEGLKLIAS